MKRSLFAVCCLAAALAGCAELPAGEDGATLGESQQDLSTPEGAVEVTVSPQSEDQPGGDRPQPEPWRAPAAAAATTPKPAPDSDPRRITVGDIANAGGDRPQPEPWRCGTSGSLTTNQ